LLEVIQNCPATFVIYAPKLGQAERATVAVEKPYSNSLLDVLHVLADHGS
jgi:hypothetical protein